MINLKNFIIQMLLVLKVCTLIDLYLQNNINYKIYNEYFDHHYQSNSRFKSKACYFSGILLFKSRLLSKCYQWTAFGGVPDLSNSRTNGRLWFYPPCDWANYGLKKFRQLYIQYFIICGDCIFAQICYYCIICKRSFEDYL